MNQIKFKLTIINTAVIIEQLTRHHHSILSYRAKAESKYSGPFNVNGGGLCVLLKDNIIQIATKKDCKKDESFDDLYTCCVEFRHKRDFDAFIKKFRETFESLNGNISKDITQKTHSPLKQKILTIG